MVERKPSFLSELEPEPVKKILRAGAGQKWTGSATLLASTIVVTIMFTDTDNSGFGSEYSIPYDKTCGVVRGC